MNKSYWLVFYTCYDPSACEHPYNCRSLVRLNDKDSEEEVKRLIDRWNELDVGTRYEYIKSAKLEGLSDKHYDLLQDWVS